MFKWIANFFKKLFGKKENNKPDAPTATVDTTGRKPMKKALLVGVNKYMMAGADLRGCVNDTKNVYDILVNTYKFPPDNIRVLNDLRATKQGMLERLNWLVTDVKAGDELVFQFSGHGSQVRDRNGDELEDGLDEILCPTNLDWNDPFTDDILAALFKTIPAGVFFTMLCDSCLSGDTTIPLLDGTEKTIKQMTEEGGDFWVYSSKPNGEVVAGRAHSPRITGKRKLIKITLDNGSIIECTKDHLIMIRDGSYKEAGDLKEEDSLMPLYRREWKETDSNYSKGYEFVRTTNSKTDRRRWLPTHIVVRDSMNIKEKHSKKSVCHHKNFNKRDNRPVNLEMVTWEHHKRSHGEIGRQNMKKVWKNEEFVAWRKSEEYRRQQSETIKESWQKPEVIKAHIDGVEKRLLLEGRRYPKAFEKWNHSLANVEHVKRMGKDERINKIKSDKSTAFWESNRGEEQRAKLLERNHKRWHVGREMVNESCEFCCPDNHKVISIEETNKFEYVYDITVDEYHNFAISAGIFVHNCHSGSMTKGLDNPCLREEKEILERFMPPPFDIASRAMGRDLSLRKIGEKPVNARSIEPQEHVLMSGCKDDQTSADAHINNTYQGAFTWALTSAIKANPDITWKEAHAKVLAALKGRYTQIPVLSGNDSLLNRKIFGGV